LGGFQVSQLGLNLSAFAGYPIPTSTLSSACRKFDRAGGLWLSPPAAPNPALLNGGGPAPMPSIPVCRSSKIVRVVMALQMLGALKG
jgi:hypothetical protein